MQPVLVIGAGLAGATAADALAAAGHPVIVIEARDRPGGRALRRPFAGVGPPVEFGGAWITPWHEGIRGLCARLGVALVPRTPIVERLWCRDGSMRADGPAGPAERLAHDRAMARVAGDAALVKMGHAADERGRPLSGVSFADYAARLGAPSATRAMLSAWWAVSGAADPAAAAATEFLASCAYGEGLPEAMTDAWSHTLADGVQGLCARLLAGPGIALRLGAPVARLSHGPRGVTAVLADGTRIAGRAAVVATGINPMAAIVFDPPLPPDRTAVLARGHLGRGVKVWARVEGVAPGTLVTGTGPGIEWLFADAADGGAALVAGFGVAAAGWVPDLPGDAVAALARAFPGARVTAVDWHDWNADPFSRGGWVAVPAGGEAGFAASNWTPLGPLAFAGSDIAPQDAGWFEGAVVSGRAAAAALAGAVRP